MRAKRLHCTHQHHEIGQRPKVVSVIGAQPDEQVGIVGHITIGDSVMIGASSGIHKSIPAGMVGGGTPFLPFREWLKVETSKAKLPEIRVKMEKLMRRVEELEAVIHKNTEGEP